MEKEQTYIVRLMNIADYDELFELWSHTKGMGLRSLDDSAEGIAKFLKRNPTTCFVVELDKKIVGGILGGNDGRRGYIYHTVVSEIHQKKGLGKLLVQTVLKAYAEDGINRVALVVLGWNQAGNGFWKSLGFEDRSDLVYRNISLNEINI